MNTTIYPKKLKGVWKAPLSKAVCHRLIICNAIRKLPIDDEWLFCDDTKATYKGILAILSGEPASVDCGDSASTYRFLKPIAKAAGCPAEFILSERLSERVSRAGNSPDFTSQGISGMLMANLLTPGFFSEIPEPVVSKGYVEMTKAAVKGELQPEGDWSLAANFVLANYLGAEVEIKGLNYSSLQPDSCIEKQLALLGGEVDVGGCPDIAPILIAASMLKALNTAFKGMERLKYKESNRVEAVKRLIEELPSGKVQTFNDHRIAMLAGILARQGYGNGTVLICGAECVSKSYPKFWEELVKL